jgi:hypothetical protein
MFRFTIRELVLVTALVGVVLGWWQERAARLAYSDSISHWWSEHLHREHYTDPNEFKRLVMREGPPFSR